MHESPAFLFEVQRGWAPTTHHRPEQLNRQTRAGWQR